MDFTLRPMSTSEVLDRMFYLYKQNFVLFAGIAILPAALSLIVQIGTIALRGGAATPKAMTPDALLVTGAGTLLNLLVLTIGGTVASAATAYALSMVHLGKTTSIGNAFSNVGPYIGWLMLLVILVGLMVAGIGILMAIPFVLMIAMPVLGGILGALGAIAGLVFIVHLYARFSLAIPACVLEKVSAIKALERSSFLTKGRTGRIWLVFLLTWLINVALAFAITMPITVSVGFMAVRGHLSLGLLIAAQVAQFVASTLSAPILTISIALLYYDERVRKEAFDLQYMMAALDQPGQQQPAAVGQ
jgi:hypothetical protein